jgi:hypothetical protein
LRSISLPMPEASSRIDANFRIHQGKPKQWVCQDSLSN